ncbi:MAG: transglycosylase domain-containing protein, partial [Saprospiraceae bacterium]|nr:transglycosylase domain-containing protein [Saprospiraceae bacterium]
EKNPLTAWVVKWLSIIGGSGLILLFIVIQSVFWSVPSVRQLRNVQTEHASEIFSADGVLLGRYFNENRTVVDYEQIPQHIVDALVATEDERFYKHGGVDYRSWGRVFYRTILQGDESGGGGSTISQQLAKNLFKRKSYRFLSLPRNKLREVAIAIRLERAYTKQEILALYLNTVPFSENVFGIDVAARRFFSKTPKELTIEEAASLIGTLKATTYYSPTQFPDRVLERRNVVLRQMVKNNYINASLRDSLEKLPLTLCYNPGVNNLGLAPYFKEFLRQELNEKLKDYKKPNGESYDIFKDGLRIYTTLDTRMQRMAEEAVQEHFTQMQRTFEEHWRGQKPWGDDSVIESAMKQSDRYKKLKAAGVSEAKIKEIFNKKIPMTVFSWEGDKQVEMSPLDSVKYYFCIMQVGFMAMEPYTGYIRAWVGGVDFDYFKYDHVKAKRQVGSAFKPIVYTEALRRGIDPCEQIPNDLILYHEYEKGDWAVKTWRREDPDPHIAPDGRDEDDWLPQNADGKYGGSYSMEGALTNSVNTITVKLIMQAGVQNVIDLARKMGIVSSEIPAEPSIALGSAGISLYEMVTAFSVFASRGRQVVPSAIQRIETYDGKVLVSYEKLPTEQVIDTLTADMITKMMQSVTSYGTASRIRWKYGLLNPLAGKTGTSQHHADGWFIGFIPNLVAGAWVGGDSPLVRFRNYQNGQGAATALPVWALFMKRVLDDPTFAEWKNAQFPQLPPEISRQLDCPLRIKSPEELLQDSLIQDSLMRLELENPGQILIPDGNQFDN